MTDMVTITRSFESRSKWKDIAKEIRNGNNGYLTVGDSISCTLKDGRNVILEIAAVDLYEKNSVIFVSKDCVVRKPMTELMDYLNNEFIKLLPDDLVEVISSRKILQNYRGYKTEIEGKLWVPTRTELFGDNWESDVDCKKFPLFVSDRSRVKNFNNSYCWYWTSSIASAYDGYSTYVCSVSSDGNAGSYGASNTYICAPLCFQIKNP